MNRIVYLTSLIISICITISNCQKFVTELQENNLDSFLKTKRMGFVQFYSPKCNHCKRIEPTYEQAAQLAKEKALDAVFSRISTDKFPTSLKKFDLEEVPTFLWFNNECDHIIPFLGDTGKNSSFVDFIEHQKKFSPSEITFEQWKKMTEKSIFRGENVMIFVGDKYKHLEKYNHIMNSAWNIDLKNLFWTKDKEFYSYYKLNSNSKENFFECLMFKVRNNSTSLDHFERLYLNDKDVQHQPEFKYTSTSYKLEGILRLFSKNIINLFDQENENMILIATPTLILAHNYKLGSREYDQMITNLSKVAMKYRKEIFFMYGSPQSKFTQIFAESYRLLPTDFPSLIMAGVNDVSQDMIEKYKQKMSKDKVPTEEELTKYIEDWKNMKLKPYVVSEDLPSKPVDENGINKLVGENFKNFIETPGKDVFLMLCTVKLDECVKFRELYAQLANMLRKNENLLFAEIDPYFNEIDLYGYNRLPGLILFPDKENKLTNFIQFQEKLTMKELMKFIEENVVHPIAKEKSEETLNKELNTSEFKSLNLEDYTILTQLNEKIIEPDQKELYAPPNEEANKKEKEYLIHKIDSILASTRELKMDL